MKKLIYLFLTITFFSSCGSEEKSETKKEKPEVKDSVDTDDSNLVEEKIVEPRKKMPKHAGSWIDRNLDNPVFYSEKVDQLVEKSKAKFQEPDEAMDFEYDFLNAKEIKKLTTTELIYYTLSYPASFSQVCAEGPMPDSINAPKISGYIPFSYESEEMSDLQWSEVNRRRDSVITLLCNFMEDYPDKVDTEYLRLLKRLDALEAIPTVIKTASEKNSSNYSFLLEMMRDNEFAPLMQQDFYDDMYGDDSYYYNNSVISTPPLRKTIIKLANQFYKMQNAD